MESPYKTPVHPPREGELAGNQMVIQQFARYPPGFDAPLRSGSPGSARSRLAASASASPPLRRKDTPRSVQSSPRGPMSGVPPPSAMRSGMSMSPPLFDASGRPRPARDAVDTERRVLPSRDLTDETIDDAYVTFILYCNPNVPLSTDTSELRKIFRSPPRSDGKSFSIFTLWELIRKLDRKELKTWIQLAIELGVEPPSLEKKQSTQKVQQYAVRLKRWMRAMHVDAFFEYCLGHPHNYYTRLPSSTGPASESRDGVPLEEDLALRALVPEWKPKRGRKRAEDKEMEEAQSAKRPHLDTSVGLLDHSALATHAATFPTSAIPFSAFPDDVDTTDPWAAAASSFASDGLGVDSLGGQELRWRPLDRDASPAGYPRSAIVPRHHQGDMFVSSEPRSAVTPSSRERSRTRRRHGPAVSSAWPSNSGSVTGKVRGRPPNRGSAPGGPFSSFPANPARSNTPGDNASMRSSPAVGIDSHLGPPPSKQTPTRPSKLQLHVPPNPGGPIRLATPPTLLVNGTNDISSGMTATNGRRDSAASNEVEVDIDGASLSSLVQRGQTGQMAQGQRAQGQRAQGQRAQGETTQQGQQIMKAATSLDEMIRLLTIRILHANVVGRPGTLQTDEARGLARAAVERLLAVYAGILPLPVVCAVHFGLGIGIETGQKLGRGPGGSGMFQSLTVKVNTATNNAENNNNSGSSLEPPPPAGRAASQMYTYSLILDSRPAPGFSFNSVLSDLSLLPSSSSSLPSLSSSSLFGATGDQNKDDMDLRLNHNLKENITTDEPPPIDLPPTDDDEFNEAEAVGGDGEGTTAGATSSMWKQRYLRLRQTMQRKETALREYKRNILQSVMADI